MSQAWKLRIGWIVAACLAALIVAAGVFVLPVLLPDKPTAYRAAPADAGASSPAREPTVAPVPADAPLPAPPSRTFTPAAAPSLPAPVSPPETPATRIAVQPSPPTNVPARGTAPQPGSPPAFPECPVPGQVQMRLTAVNVVPAPLAISGARGLDFQGVFENAADVPVYIQRGELFVYSGQPPQPGLATKVTFFNGGPVPAHGTLPFTLDTVTDFGSGTPGLQWHVRDNGTTVQALVAAPSGAGYSCGPVAEGSALSW